jgi:hypothetical protein
MPQELNKPEESFSQDILLLFELVNEQHPNLRKQFLEFMKGSIFVPPSFGLKQLVSIYKGSSLSKEKSFGDLMQVILSSNSGIGAQGQGTDGSVV